MKVGMKVGILGGGQLARMLILAGLPLGLQFRIYSDRQDEATSTFDDVHYGSYDDQDALRRFAAGLDLITFEFENLSTAGILGLQ
ncbi:MAG: 5-(carboxyamino)imidazole ribonucleotide synthase, partial [Proteobacteria bacterium]|nr:5-(carboxyamino)imidazole ribonucleotide synthase [Pseudomonadota bacterium]